MIGEILIASGIIILVVLIGSYISYMAWYDEDVLYGILAIIYWLLIVGGVCFHFKI